MHSTANHRPFLLIAFLLAMTGIGTAGAQVSQVRTAINIPHAESQILGSQFRDPVKRAVAEANKGNLDAAQSLLAPVISYCDGLIATGRAMVSVSNAEEYQAYMATRADNTPVDWVDIACPHAYSLMGFIANDKHDYATGIAFLDKAIALAPLWADPLVERGSALNQTQSSDKALLDFQRAIELADRYSASKPYKAIALRGLGYAQVELGDLDAAERAYRESLELDPESDVAKHELQYIQSRRKAGTVPPDK